MDRAAGRVSFGAVVEVTFEIAWCLTFKLLGSGAQRIFNTSSSFSGQQLLCSSYAPFDFRLTDMELRFLSLLPADFV